MAAATAVATSRALALGQLEDAEAGGRLAVAAANDGRSSGAPSSTRATSFNRVIRPLSLGLGLDDDLAELARRSASRPSMSTVYWKCCSAGRRRLADLAGGDLHVLLAHRVDTSCGPDARACSWSGSSQIRML